MLRSNLIQSLAGFKQPSVGPVSSLWLKAHCCTFGAACLGLGIICSRCMPCQTNQKRTDVSIVIFRFVEDVLYVFFDLVPIHLGS